MQQHLLFGGCQLTDNNDRWTDEGTQAAAKPLEKRETDENE
jgi:hypothetical protein